MATEKASSAKPKTPSVLPEAWGNEPTPWHVYLLALGAAGLLLTQEAVWAMGLFVCITGLVLWKKAPRLSVSRAMEGAMLVTLGIGLLSLLPYIIYRLIPLRWFKQGRWRGLVNEADIPISFSYSPQALLTFEKIITLAAIAICVILLVHAVINTASRWRQALLLCVGIAAAAALSALGILTVPAADTVFGIGAVLTTCLLLHALYHRAKRTALVLLLCAGAIAAGMIVGHYSMWPWATLAVGLWLVLQAFQTRKISGIFRTAFVVLWIVALTLVIFAQLRGANWFEPGYNKLEGNALRKDTMSMLIQQPAFGVGMGNFEYVFPFYQKRSVQYGLMHNPGNDWLWITSETGVIGLCAVAALAIAGFIPLVGKSGRLSMPVRNAAMAAILVFFVGTLLHSPAHSPAALLLLVALFQISRNRSVENDRSFLPKWAWKIQAVVLMLVGLMWLLAGVANLPLQSSVAYNKGEKLIAAGIAESSMQTVQDGASMALFFTPMAWHPYQERARAYILLENNISSGKADMERPLLLLPNSSDVAMEQGLLWLPYSIREAELSFSLAVTRHNSDPENLYRRIVSSCADNSYFQGALERLSHLNSRIRFAYMNGASLAAFNSALAVELRTDTSLKRFTNAERRQILERWVQQGNATQAVAYLQNNPQVTEDPWFLRALALARLNRHKEAGELMKSSLPMAQIPNLLPSQERRIHLQDQGIFLPISATADTARPSANATANAATNATTADAATTASTTTPTNADAANAEGSQQLQMAGRLQNQLHESDWQGARQSTDWLLARPAPPAYAFYWSAWLHHEAGSHLAAWEHWEKYARHYLNRRWEVYDAEAQGRRIQRAELSTDVFHQWQGIPGKDKNADAANAAPTQAAQ